MKPNTVTTTFVNPRTELLGYVDHMQGAIDRTECVIVTLRAALEAGNLPTDTVLSTLDAASELLSSADVNPLRAAIVAGFPSDDDERAAAACAAQ